MFKPANKLLRKKLQSERYLRSTFVLAIDMFVSLLATGVVLLFADLLELGGIGDTKFTFVWICAAFLGSLLGFVSSRSYHGVIRHSTLRELATLVEAVIEKEIVILLATAIFLMPNLSTKVYWVLPVIDLLVTVSFLVVIRVSMVITYDFLSNALKGKDTDSDVQIPKVLVYGTGEKSISLSTRYVNSSHFDIQGYITREASQNGKQLNGKTIYAFNDTESLSDIKHRLHIDGIIFPEPRDVKREADGLVEYGRHLRLRLFVAPSVDEVSENDKLLSGMRDIRIEDLLGREEIEISLEEVKADINGRKVLVTGAAGSIGSELCRQLARLGAGCIIMFDNAETPLHYLRLEFDDKFKWVETIPVIGDVRSRERIDFVFRHFKPDLVFHAAAYKHVPLMEENPCEAVMVNVFGTRHIADKCVEYGVGKMVMVSTDKAVNPTNIMGCTKRLAEIYVQSLGLAIESGSKTGQTRFVTTRFGNVLGSNGSVIPRFKEQIAAGGPVTVTHPEIRRFFMTIPEACRLVLEAATMARGTRIYAFDMGQPVKIADLAARMIELAGFEVDTDIKIVFSGLRPGEKLYEEVLADKENTTPTTHRRIFEAMVREYEYEEVSATVDRLTELAMKVEIRPMVKLMKQTVPEFKSRQSAFSELDEEISKEQN